MNRRGPTLEDVAREAGVSRATVSRVVNGVRNVDPALQDVVRQAVERTGYTPNGAARSLVTRRAETVALLISGAGDEFAARVFADPFFGRIVSGAVAYLRGRAMHPVLMLAESESARRQVVDYLRQGSADGALVVSIQADDPLPRMLCDARIPLVLFARSPHGPRSAPWMWTTSRAGGSPPGTCWPEDAATPRRSAPPGPPGRPGPAVRVL